jgi:hypothetical protein
VTCIHINIASTIITVKEEPLTDETIIGEPWILAAYVETLFLLNGMSLSALTTWGIG